jgi:hypothetical protein
MARRTLSKELEEYLQNQRAMQTAAEKVRSSLQGSVEVYKDMHKLSASIAFVEKQILKLRQEEARLENKKLANNNTLSVQDEQQLILLKRKIKLQQEDIATYREKSKLISSQLNATNLIVAAGNSLVKSGKANWKWYVEQDKAIKMSALNMGILKSTSRDYWNNITKAALQTNILGSSAADLAKMQANYSESIGRMVVLSQQGLIAMSEMAEGTTLGAEGAAQMASSMDMFGISVVGARDKVQETVDLAHKMGMNASKVLKSLQQNLKLAQTYNFKKGISGVIEMTAYSEKLKINMQSIAGFAAQVSNPEGAVEAAATLQTLGGAWAQLADPFRLMYEARNDMESFTKSIGEATAGTFRFNRVTGEVDKSALELSRLREVAKATNIPFEELSEIAHRMAMTKSIDMDINPTIRGDKGAKEFIESTATWSKDKKGFVISVGGKPEQLINTLTKEQIKAYKDEKESIASRAESSKDFDEQWANIVNTFKTALLPAIKGIFEGLGGAMKKFTDWGKKGSFEKLFSVAQKIGDGLKWAIDQLAKSPLLSIGVILGGWAALKAATWIANGVALGIGFNSVARGGGGGGYGPSMPGGGSSGGGGTSGPSMYRKSTNAGYYKNGAQQNFSGKIPAGSKFQGATKGGFANSWGGKNPMLRGAGATIGLGAGAALSDEIGSNLDPDSFGGKAMGINSATLKGASALSMFGPWGMLAGGIAGTGVGAYQQLTKDKTLRNQTLGNTKYGSNGPMYHDFAMPIPIDSSDKVDTLIGHKPSGPIDQRMNSSNGASNVKHSFDDIKITGRIELVGNDGKTLDEDILKNNPVLMRTLTRMIQTEVKKGSSGGKVNNNVSK